MLNMKNFLYIEYQFANELHMSFFLCNFTKLSILQKTLKDFVIFNFALILKKLFLKVEPNIFIF